MSEKLGPLPDKSGTLWELRTPRNGKPFQYWTEQDLINYAAQEVAKERERCAKVAEEFLTNGRNPHGKRVAEAIRSID